MIEYRNDMIKRRDTTVYLMPNPRPYRSRFIR